MPSTRSSETLQPMRNTVHEISKRLDSMRHRTVVIYGAGKIGLLLHKALRNLRVRVDSFWDMNASQLEAVPDTAVVEPQTHRIAWGERKNYVIFVAIFSESVTESLRSQLAEAGYEDVIVDRALINDILFMDCKNRSASAAESLDINDCVFCPRITTRNSSCSIFFQRLTNSMGIPPCETASVNAIPSMGILTTTRCTLTCSGCNHLRDHFRPEHNFDIPFSDIAGDLDTILRCVDVINKLVVVGGEAFLHPELDRILQHLLTLKQVGIVHIITNGTILPKDERMYDLLSNNRIIVEISGYGDRLPSAMQKNVDRFLDAMTRRGINHRHTRTMQWFDFGGFDKRNYTAQQWDQVYASCCFISNDLFNGRLYSCSRSALGTFLGKLPDYPHDYVEIRGAEPESLREKLNSFFDKKHADACQHCNGTTSATIVPGCQASVVCSETNLQQSIGEPNPLQKGLSL